jgi:hypothetical protein
VFVPGRDRSWLMMVDMHRSGYLIAFLAAVVMAASLGACSSPPAPPRACNVERLVLKDMDGGAVNGQAMGTYATALADSGTTGPLAAAVTTAVHDANNAQEDVGSGDMSQYAVDARAFIADLEVIQGDCLHGVS